ncbi:MAG: acyl carrier protein [Deltaproteobacteria bacterium]|nr:acyl carrier protein [Deltaproteobacteria bacterium]
MSREAFLNKLEAMQELAQNSLTGAERYVELQGWDSLAVLAFLSLADEDYGVTLSPDDVRRCNTVDDLYALVQPKKAG